MSRRVSMRYRGAEGLACPLCAEAGEFVQLTNIGWMRRDDHRSPDGVSYERIVATRVTDRRLFPDDEEVSKAYKTGAGSGGIVTRWRHHYTLECPRHPVAFNRREAVPHDFAEGELPDDYWEGGGRRGE